jgi:copper(I)-binding protein
MTLRALSLVLVLASAFTAQAADIAVEQPWARATPGRAPNGAAYFTLANTGKEADRLVAASTPAAGKAELHTHVHSGTIMEMRPVDAIEVKPGEKVTLKPGDMHVMLMGLKAPLKEGATLALTLRFARAGEITVDVPIGRAGASGPAK